MRILFYNWVDYLDDEKRGGGVTVYQRNVMRALAPGQAPEGVEAVFLSSGISYDLFSSRPRWEQVRHGSAEDRARRFEIINSGTLAPSHHSFSSETQIDHPATTEAFFDFLDRKGPFDVVHFNNLEGLPATALQLKQRFPNTRVVFSLHNYYPVCPQVNLWFDEKENCRDFRNGAKCDSCLPWQHDERAVRLANGVAFTLKKWGIRPGSRIFDRAFLPALRVARRSIGLYGRIRRKLSPGLAAAAVASGMAKAKNGQLTQLSQHAGFQQRRADFVRLINENCDVVLGVSRRVCDVAAHFGIRADLLRTSYIGTAQAPKWAETVAKPTILPADGTLTIAYLGYMRMDKGFYFLLDALEDLPDDMAARIRLVICARRGDHHTMRRITALVERFADVLYADGYSHDNLDDLLADVDLGVVPVLWEDNLPQVAIEMHARHIPLLTADMGGAQELADCPAMTFRAGSIRSFTERLAAILAGEVAAEDYWSRAMAPVSMEEHVDELLAIFRDDAAAMPAPHQVQALPAVAAKRPSLNRLPSIWA